MVDGIVPVFGGNGLGGLSVERTVCGRHSFGVGGCGFLVT